MDHHVPLRQVLARPEEELRLPSDGRPHPGNRDLLPSVQLWQLDKTDLPARLLPRRLLRYALESRAERRIRAPGRP